MTRFEDRLEERLRAFARTGVQPVDSTAVARAVAAGHPKSGTRPAVRLLGAEIHRTRQRAVFGPWTTRSMFKPSLAVAAVVAVLVAGALLTTRRDQPEIGNPSPSLPGVAAPSSTPSGPTAEPTASPVTNPAGLWIATGTMGTPRYDHAAVRLLDGRVLVLGGSSGDGSDVTSAELYDPLSGTWSATGNMIRPRLGFPPTLLRDGRVLVGDALGEDRPGAELYDPNSGTWSATGQMVRGEEFGDPTATLLRDGKVLVAGLHGAELYDPDSGRWTATGKMTTPRYYTTATLLPDGRVLAAGGFFDRDVATDVAELYDPNTGSWTAIANMNALRGHHTATLLRDGKVLGAGSSNDPAGLQFEVYDPATGTWTALPVRPDLSYRMATLLSDDRVLVIGFAFDSVAAELYHPSTGSWTTAAPMLRSHGTPAISLLDGTVLVAGGNDCLDGVCVATGSAELYVPAGVSPPPLPAFPSPPPPVIPSPTPIPPPLPPEAGPVPAGARSWKVTVVNKSSVAATLFLAEDGGNGIRQLCGSVTPNVVPAGVTEQVTFLLPPKNVRGCWIDVNPVRGDVPGSLFETSDAPMAGEILIREDGESGWSGP